MEANNERIKRSKSRIYFLGMLIIFIQVVQMYNYQNNPSYRVYFNGLLAIWISSKVFCTVVQLYISQDKSFYYRMSITVRAIFSTEIISLMEEIYTEKELVKSWMLGAIGQIHVYALPIFLINNYIIISQELNQQVDTQIYVIMIIDIVLVSFCNLLVQIVKNKIDQMYQPLLFTTMSFCRCFIFWHILGQFYVLNQYLLIAWILIHVVIAAIMVQYLEDSECRVAAFISYLFQLELFLIREKESKQYSQTPLQAYNLSFSSKKWSVILYFFLLQFNLVLFIFIKILSRPILVKTDYLIYILFPFLIPGIIWTVEIFYNKLIIGWRVGELNLCQTVNKLKENLLYSGKIFIELNGINQINSTPICNKYTITKSKVSVSPSQNQLAYYKKLFQDIREIKRALKIACKGNFESLEIKFYDSSQYQNHNCTQKLILRSQYNKELALQIIDIIQYIINPDSTLQIDAKDSEILQLLFNVIRFEPLHLNLQVKQKNLIKNVVAANLSAFSFYKVLSKYIPINPSLVLYDLLEETLG